MCAVIRPGKLRCELHLGRLEPEMKRPGAFIVKERACSRKLPNVFVLCLRYLCGVSFCKELNRAQKKINAMICAMFQDEFSPKWRFTIFPSASLDFILKVLIGNMFISECFHHETMDVG